LRTRAQAKAQVEAAVAHRPRAQEAQDRVDRVDPTADLAVRVVQVDPADLAAAPTGLAVLLAVPVGLVAPTSVVAVPVDLAGLVGLTSTAGPVGLVDLTSMAGLAVPADQAGLASVDPTGTTGAHRRRTRSVGTAALHGVTDPRRGVGADRLAPAGVDRSLLLAVSGTRDR
jgi:hypothetical protein